MIIFFTFFSVLIVMKEYGPYLRNFYTYKNIRALLSHFKIFDSIACMRLLLLSQKSISF